MGLRDVHKNIKKFAPHYDLPNLRCKQSRKALREFEWGATKRDRGREGAVDGYRFRKFGSQKSGKDRCQMSEVRGQEGTDVGYRRSGLGRLLSILVKMNSEILKCWDKR